MSIIQLKEPQLPTDARSESPPVEGQCDTTCEGNELNPEDQSGAASHYTTTTNYPNPKICNNRQQNKSFIL